MIFLLCAATSVVHAQDTPTRNHLTDVMAIYEAGDPFSMPERLAFMSGHIEAGLALYRAGHVQAAAPHLLHPVSETHAAERVGLDELGFNAELFARVSRALYRNIPAERIERQLDAAQQNLASLATKVGGDQSQLIHFLLDQVILEYAVAVIDGEVTDEAEYHDAFGFVVVALQRAGRLDGARRGPVLAALQSLRAQWPAEAPIAPDAPVSLAKVVVLVDAVRDELNLTSASFVN